MKRLFFTLLLLITMGCQERYEPAVVVPDDYLGFSLAKIGPDYLECSARYNNTLFEKGDHLRFKMNVIHIFPERNYLKQLIDSEDVGPKSDSIIQSLNNFVRTSKISFQLNEYDKAYTGESIDDFFLFADRYDTYGVITLLVFHTDRVEYNGVALSAPGNLAGIHIDRAFTETLPHEIGHLFGLHHPFGSSKRSCDIPDHTFDPMEFDKHKCEYKVGKPHYTDEQLEYEIGNFMAYTDDCRHFFTPVQNKVMRFYIEMSPKLFDALL